MARFETLFRDSTLEDSRLVARLLAVPPPHVCPSPRPRSASREESANGVAPLASLQALNSFFIHSETFETKVSTSQRTSLARACKFASRVFLYRRLHARKNMYTHAHIHSVIFCSLYIVCISLRFPRISELVSIISLQASINRLLHSENRLLLFLSLSLRASRL